MDGTTGIVIATICALAALIISILRFYSEKNKDASNNAVEQAKLNVKLISIEKEVIEIKTLLLATCDKLSNTDRDYYNRYNELEKRVTNIETSCKFIQERKNKGGKTND